MTFSLRPTLRPAFLAFFALALTLGLAGCNNNIEKSAELTGDTAKERRLNEMDSIMGEGGLSLLGGRQQSGGGSIGVNGYLWRASLDTITTMPISLVDPFGGVILTDWYALDEHPDIRYKINVFIRGRELRTANIKVSVFKQRRQTDGSWVTIPLPEGADRGIENIILTRARDLRLVAYAQ